MSLIPAFELGLWNAWIVMTLFDTVKRSYVLYDTVKF